MKVNFSWDLKKYYNSEKYECFMAVFCFTQTRGHCFHDKSVPLGFLSAHCHCYQITNEGTMFHWLKVFLFQALPWCHCIPAVPANRPSYWMKQLSYLCSFGLSLPMSKEAHWSMDDLDSELHATCPQSLLAPVTNDPPLLMSRCQTFKTFMIKNHT